MLLTLFTQIMVIGVGYGSHTTTQTPKTYVRRFANHWNILHFIGVSYCLCVMCPLGDNSGHLSNLCIFADLAYQRFIKLKFRVSFQLRSICDFSNMAKAENRKTNYRNKSVKLHDFPVKTSCAWHKLFMYWMHVKSIESSQNCMHNAVLLCARHYACKYFLTYSLYSFRHFHVILVFRCDSTFSTISLGLECSKEVS